MLHEHKSLPAECGQFIIAFVGELLSDISQRTVVPFRRSMKDLMRHCYWNATLLLNPQRFVTVCMESCECQFDVRRSDNLLILIGLPHLISEADLSRVAILVINLLMVSVGMFLRKS